MEPTGEEQLPGRVNYFFGSDPAKWHADIPTYAKVRYTGIYPGIDLIFHGSSSPDGKLEFDFVIAPHAAPRAIRLQFSGQNHLHVAPNGDLIVSTNGETVPSGKPRFIRPWMAGKFLAPESMHCWRRTRLDSN